MRYPNSSKTYHKVVSHANRGMTLENLINDANKFYNENNIAVICKKPTPIGIVSVSGDENSKIITKAYFKEPSTLDYNGVYKGKYIEFDAKQTSSKTSFPISNISTHQIEYLKKIINHGAIAFLIIEINNEYYLFSGNVLIKYIEVQKKKSIPYKLIKELGYKIKPDGLIIVNYLPAVDKLIGGLHEKNKELF